MKLTIKKLAFALLAGMLLAAPAVADTAKTLTAAPSVTASQTVGVKKAVVSVQPYTGKALIRWTMPENKAIDSYAVTVTDAKGNVVREWSGIVKESNSVLIKGLMPQFSFTATVLALDARGNELYRSALRSSTGPATDNRELVTFNVTYTTPVGSLFGLEEEKVVFGGSVSKTPSVIVPEGYVFVGWSVDGISTVELDDFSIYADTEFTAVIAHK